MADQHHDDHAGPSFQAYLYVFYALCVCTALSFVGGLGVLALPVAAAVDLLVRRRPRQLVDAVSATVLVFGIALLTNFLMATLSPGNVIIFSP